MASGTKIVVTPNPKGVFKEGIISGTPKPGTLMQIKAATEPINGSFTYEVYNPDSDGDRRAIIVLDVDDLQGKTATDAYVDGDRCFMYCPLMGEELNMLLEDVGGTGDDHAIGAMLMGDDGTGKLLAESSPQAEPFQVLETITDPVADTLTHCMYTGY